MWKSIDDWCLSLRAAGRPSSTVQLRRHQLRRLAADHPRGPAAVGEVDLVAWLGGHAWARETLRSHRAALRLYFAWATRHGLCATNPAEHLAPVPARPPMPRPAPEWVFAQAIGTTDPAVRLMVFLAGYAGLRRGEIARARADWLVEDLVGWSLRVLGKGERWRLVPIPGWLAELVQGRGEGWLFPGGTADGHVSAYWVGRLVSRALPGDWTAHSLRHRYATRVYAGSRDLLAVQQLLGHARPETTQRYVRVASDQLRDAARWAA